MNAYELADYLDYKLENVFPHHQDTIDMLRQQADKIAELEKTLQDGIKTFGELQFQLAKDKFETPQTKPLSDEEILEIASPMFVDVRYPSTAIELARAIEAKVRGQ